MASTAGDFESIAYDYFDELRTHRRNLHRIPELGDCEVKTQQYIINHLKKLGPDQLDILVCTGVKAVFRGNGKGRVIAFRADIDALPVEEANECDYKSEHAGCMHACGHDGHMANLLAFASYLSCIREKLCDDVVLIFQPAEETVGGAERMIREGALTNPKVDVIYGMHMMPSVPKGKIACCEGPIMAQTCEMDFVIKGKAAHGATPHLGIDAVTAMAHLLTLFQTTVARTVDPCQQALITIGRVEAGTQRNILANCAKLEGIVRTFSNDVYEKLEKRIRDDIKGIESAFGVEIEFIKRIYYPCTNNDSVEFNYVKRQLGSYFMQARPLMTAEDFSFYQLSVPGVFVFCGCQDEQHCAPLHANNFDFDETSLIPGFALFASLIHCQE